MRIVAATVVVAAFSFASAHEPEWTRHELFRGTIVLDAPPGWVAAPDPKGLNVMVRPAEPGDSRVLFSIPNPAFGDDVEGYLTANVRLIMDNLAQMGELRVVENRAQRFGDFNGHLIGFAVPLGGEDEMLFIALGFNAHGYCSMAMIMTPGSRIDEAGVYSHVVESMRYVPEKLREHADWLEEMAAAAGG
ncbi:MAG: hypothetical protein LBJ46_03525 [Planctomycetota bacterium]|nr:hypothetical protein [Planctomycetota bacterium]